MSATTDIMLAPAYVNLPTPDISRVPPAANATRAQNELPGEAPPGAPRALPAAILPFCHQIYIMPKLDEPDWETKLRDRLIYIHTTGTPNKLYLKWGVHVLT